MKSALPKVLHPLAGQPLFLHALTTAERLAPVRIAVVIGHGADAVRRAYGGGGVAWVIQDQQLGTGHAVLCAKEIFESFSGEVLILSGDVPLIKEETLRSMVEKHRRQTAVVTLLTASLNEPQVTAGCCAMAPAASRELWKRTMPATSNGKSAK